MLPQVPLLARLMLTLTFMSSLVATSSISRALRNQRPVMTGPSDQFTSSQRLRQQHHMGQRRDQQRIRATHHGRVGHGNHHRHGPTPPGPAMMPRRAGTQTPPGRGTAGITLRGNQLPCQSPVSPTPLRLLLPALMPSQWLKVQTETRRPTHRRNKRLLLSLRLPAVARRRLVTMCKRMTLT